MSWKEKLSRFLRDRNIRNFPPGINRAVENQLYNDLMTGNYPASDTEKEEMRELFGLGLYKDSHIVGITVSLAAVGTFDLYEVPKALYLKAIWGTYINAGAWDIGYGDQGQPLPFSPLGFPAGVTLWPEECIYSFPTGVGIASNQMLIEFKPEAKYIPSNKFIQLYSAAAITTYGFVFIFEKG